MSRPDAPTLRLDGARVRSIREAKGLTQLYVAEVVGVSVDTVSRWENNRTASVRRENAEALARALEVELEEILPATRPGPPRKRGRPVWLAGALASALVLAAAWWLWVGGGEVEARRLLPPYCPPGTRIPVVIEVEAAGTRPVRVVVREELPRGWAFEGAVPPPAQGPGDDGVVRWILTVSGGSARIGYVVRAPAGPEGSTHRFRGRVVTRARGDGQPIRGEARTDLEYVHWADQDADFEISDAEVLGALERLDAVAGLGLSAGDLRALWGAGEYEWDEEKGGFVGVETSSP